LSLSRKGETFEKEEAVSDFCEADGEAILRSSDAPEIGRQLMFSPVLESVSTAAFGFSTPNTQFALIALRT